MKHSLHLALAGVALLACSAGSDGTGSVSVPDFQGSPGSLQGTGTPSPNLPQAPAGPASTTPADQAADVGVGSSQSASDGQGGANEGSAQDVNLDANSGGSGTSPSNGAPPSNDADGDNTPPSDDGNPPPPSDNGNPPPPSDNGNPPPPSDNGNGNPPPPSDDGSNDPPPPDLVFGSGPLANGLCAANTGLGSGSAGKDSSYAVLHDGTAVHIKAGSATFLQYSDGSPVNDAIAISNGSYSDQFCFARVSGAMHCGTGDSASPTASQASGVLAISSRGIGGTVCAIMDDLTLACGGPNGLTPTSTGSNLPVTQLGCFRNDGCCIIDTAGEIHCVGENVTPTAGPDARALIVTGMDENQCAVYDDGRSYCWGSANFGGQTGGSPVQANPIAPVPIEGAMASVAGGQFHACWVLRDGTVTCSGNGGGTGNGAGGESEQPVAIRDEAGNLLSNVLAVTANRGTSCAATSSGDLYCWGAAGGQGAVAVRIDLGGRRVRMPDNCLAL